MYERERQIKKKMTANIRSNFQFHPYMMFFLSLMMLVIGLEEFKKERKAYGWLLVLVFLFSLSVSIQGFLLN